MKRRSDESKARVLIVDDERLLTDLLVSQLEETCAPTVAASWGEALRLIPSEPWAGMMIDVCLPGRKGTELLPIVRRLHPQIPVLLMTGGDAGVWRAAHEHNAAFVPKPLPSGTIEDFCALVYAPNADARFTRALRAAGMSEAEIPVIVALATGASAETVAAQLGLAPSTVKNHATNARGRVNARSILELVHRLRA